MINYEVLMGLKVLFWLPIVLIEWSVFITAVVAILTYFVERNSGCDK